MNKIIMDEEIYVLEDGVRNIEINCNTKIYINNIEGINLCITLLDGVSVSLYHFNRVNTTVNIEVKQNNNSEFNYYHAFQIDGDYKLNYTTNISGDNNINNIKILGISNGNAVIDVDGVIKKNTKHNNLDETIKILTIKGKATVKPMMHINIKECLANHNTAISNVREDEIFYLNCKGIDTKTAIKLICDGYLYILFKDEEEFLKLINN